MITGDLRRAIARAVADEGLAPADPGLRPGGGPGRYAASVALSLAADPGDLARRLARRLAGQPPIASAEVTGPGYLTITVTPEALAALPDRIARAGDDCARGDALRGATLAAPAPVDLARLAAASWEDARKAVAAELTARLAAAAGATITAPHGPERGVAPPQPASPASCSGDTPARSAGKGGEAAAAGQRRAAGGVAAAVAFAGPDAVRFSLARAMPGRPVRIAAEKIARHVPDNPAYAVRYAHARAASGVRWAATPCGAEAVPRRPPADPGELVLLDALSWLPERVATAARRGRPDEFARYLEELAGATIAALVRCAAGHPGGARAPGSGKLALARAAQAGLAAGLGLLRVSAPDRL